MTMTGRLPYRSVLTYERVHDETGREMHKSTGNAIEANEAFEQMGADIVRWQYCAQNPSQNINFGYGPAEEVKRRLLTLWNSAGFLVTYANIAGWQPKWDAQPSSEHALDRWLVARTGQLVAEGESAFERSWTPAVTTAFESYVEDLSNWYIRRSRRRFWDGEPEALETLWWSIVQSLRVVAPLMPFLADHLWRALVPDGPDSVHLAGWPEAAAADETLLDEMAAVRRVVAARPPGSRAVGPEAAPAAAAARRPGRRGRAGPGERDRRGAERQAGRVRAGRGDRAARQAEPARCSGRSSARSSGRCARSSRPASSRSSTTAACASTATSSRPTR